jgi:hypothetical protein
MRPNMVRVVLVVLIVVSCATLARSQSLDFQATCATQARKAFQEWEKDQNDPNNKSFRLISGDYQSHYNTKLKKCLILIEATHSSGNKQFSTVALLSDAYERRMYAYYQWISKENKFYWEVPPISCELTPSLRNKRFCTTREEFDAFVADYMEE